MTKFLPVDRVQRRAWKRFALLRTSPCIVLVQVCETYSQRPRTPAGSGPTSALISHLAVDLLQAGTGSRSWSSHQVLFNRRATATDPVQEDPDAGQANNLLRNINVLGSRLGKAFR
jgi:hypothetical protein